MGCRSRSALASLGLSVAVIIVLTGSASAQGLFGGELTGLPLFGGFTGEIATCWPTKSVCGPLTFYAGWGDDRKGTTLSFDLRRADTGPFGDDLISIINTYPVRGLWLGLAAQANLTAAIGLYADAWVIIPSNRLSEETFSVASPFLGGKTWRTNTDWWFADGALSFDSRGFGKLLAGFRYDRFATNFKYPDNFAGAVGLSSDRGDVTINCYLPFVGLQVDQKSPGGSQLTLRVIGFPWAGGDVKYHDSIGSGVLTEDRIELAKGLNKTYFLEAFAEYGQAVLGSGQISVFARWNMLHGTAKRIPIDDVFGGVPLVGRYQFAFDRQSWTFGGSLSLAFTIP